MNHPVYVTIEGIDGAGKSAAVDAVAEELRMDGGVVRTREPADFMRTGEWVREALSSETGPMTDVFLMMADRAEHLHSTVLPALEDGDHVVSDRGFDSTFAYQPERMVDGDGGLGLPTDGYAYEWLEDAYSGWNIEPDLVILLDLPAEEAIGRTDGEEKYEELGFLGEARQAYLERASLERDRFEVVDVSGLSEAETADAARRALLEGLGW